MYIEVGKIVGVWGVKGWVKLHSYTRNREDIATYKTWCLSRAERDKKVDVSASAVVEEITVLNCRAQGQSIVAYFDGVDSRDSAAEMNGLSILVKQSDLPELPDQEFYWHQLIGLTVINGSTELGTIKSILETGANDVLVITPVASASGVEEANVSKETTGKNQDSSEVLIPYVDSVVQNVDLATKTMQVDWDLSYLDD